MSLGVAVLALASCSLVAASVPRQYGSITFTTTHPGASTGTVLDVYFQNPDDPTQKPYAVDTMVIDGPAGTVVDTTVPPQCHATDAEIYLMGPAACPADSQIGSGDAWSDQGPNAGPNRYTHSTLTHFNNQDQVIGVGVTDGPPAITTIDRTDLQGTRSTSHFPLFPGFPPPEPTTPAQHVYVKLNPYERDSRAYHLTPPTCPKSRYWTFKLTFNYRDGVSEAIESRSPCTKS